MLKDIEKLYITKMLIRRGEELVKFCVSGAVSVCYGTSIF